MEENKNMCCNDCKYVWLSPLDNKECICCDLTKENNGFQNIMNRYDKKSCCEIKF